MGAKKAQPVTEAQAAALVKSGDWVDYGFGLAQPDAFDRALAARAAELEQVRIRSALTVRPRAVLQADPEAEHFLWFNWHFSSYDRKQHDAGRCNYIPMNFGEAPSYYRRFIDPISVACIKTAPMDSQGYFNFGCSTTYLRAMIERSRTIIVETTEAMPRVPGPDNAIHARDVDFVIDDGTSPLAEIGVAPSGDVERQVAQLIAAEIEDGACLQIGIGGMPNAVCSLLRHANVRDLGIHTEMFVDGIADLIEAGIVTNARKQMDVGRSVFSFALGSGRLYRMIDGTIRTCPTTLRATTRSSRSTTPRRSICRDRRPRNPAAIATSAAPAASCSSCGEPTPPKAASRFCACPQPSAKALCAKVALSPR